MIAFLKGTILNKNEKKIILLVNNVGYDVTVSQHISQKLQKNSEIELFIHNHIREDAFDLYGFEKISELDFFKKLISISGIGPKVGLEICNHPISKTKKAILNEDLSFITSIPGIGKKTAQRLILELKSKIELKADEISEQSVEINDDIISALENLGYQRKHIQEKLSKAPQSLKSEEEIITYFLKN